MSVFFTCQRLQFTEIPDLDKTNALADTDTICFSNLRWWGFINITDQFLLYLSSPAPGL